MAVSKGEIFVSPLADNDIPASFRVLSKSFGHDAPFVDIYFPAHDTPAGQAQGSKRLQAWKQSAPNSTFLKAVTKTGSQQERLIGIAIWTHMEQAPPAELDQTENVVGVWPDERDREFMTRLWREYVVPRSQAINESQGKGVYGALVLELLAVDPDYQRLGAGKALVSWGTRVADEKGLQSVVEGTPVGRRLYEQCGMRAEIEEMRFDVGEKFSSRRKPHLIFLTREPHF
ncbi:hypothetical protein DM02DRAFT_535230 [Periconia macrospinosa]|uniref:N-acetyltransferase domain-containing protein n=1 Tax=Periconia macrospinosa TaxID=97972 RepID=A0A2V1DE95_9PLEO|nr:hypothetical protein DM02DRAFT_535230 [Periconia macrospinosa]